MADDAEVSLLVGLLEGDLDAKPLGQGDNFLHGVVAVDVVSVPTGEALLHQMAAVGGGVDHHVAALGGDAALQNCLQGAEIVVILLEGQVVDEQDEFQRVGVQLVQNGGNGVELLLAHLQNPQTPVGQLVDHRLDGGGLAGARVAGKQNVGGGLALQQGNGVVQNDLLLPLVVHQGGKPGLVGIDDRDNVIAAADIEHDVLGVDAVAEAVDIGAALVVAVHNIQSLCGENRQGTRPVQPLPEGFRGEVGNGLQNFQLLLHFRFHFRPGLCPFANHADVGVFVVVDDVLDVARQGALFRGVQFCHKIRVFGHGLGGRAGLAAGEKRVQGGDHRVTQQCTEDGQGVQTDVQFTQIHTFRIAPFAPLETRAA